VNRVSLAAVAAIALIGAAACQDAVTSPGSSNDLTLRYRIAGNPPPPPIDTGANGTFIAATLRAEPTPRSLGPRYSIFQSSSPAQKTKFSVSAPPTRGAFVFTQTAINFNLPITYFFNPTSHSGYVHFSNDPDGVNSSSNGMIKEKNGVLSGKGTLTIDVVGGPLIIDLSSLVQEDSFLGCPSGDAPTQNNGGVCFHFTFSSATLNGVPGSVDMRPGCSPEGADSEVNDCPTFFEID